MYDFIHTKNDVIRERFIEGAELSGIYGFPELESVNADVSGLNPVPFDGARKEMHPKQSILHCFTHDKVFESLWREPLKSIETLQNFKYIIPPDFSFYSDMPLALQIYQVYRTRAIHHYLSRFGIRCIPVAGWGGIESFEWCFDGLPQGSTLAVSTNGCFSADGKRCFRKGFSEMCRRLKPKRVIVVGRPISVPEDVEIQYLESSGQQADKKLGGRNHG